MCTCQIPQQSHSWVFFYLKEMKTDVHTKISIWAIQWGIMGVNMITKNQKQTKGPPTSKPINTWNPQDKGLPRISELPETQLEVAVGNKTQFEESSRKMPDRSQKNNNNNTHTGMKHFFAQCFQAACITCPLGLTHSVTLWVSYHINSHGIVKLVFK